MRTTEEPLRLGFTFSCRLATVIVLSWSMEAKLQPRIAAHLKPRR